MGLVGGSEESSRCDFTLFLFFFVSRPDWMSAGNRRKLQLEVEAVPKSIGNDWP